MLDEMYENWSQEQEKKARREAEEAEARHKAEEEAEVEGSIHRPRTVPRHPPARGSVE